MDQETKKFLESIKNELQGFRKETNNRFDGLEGRMGGIENNVGKLEGRMGGIESHVGKLEGRMGGIESHVGKLEGRMGGIENNIGKLEGRMGGLEAGQKESYDILTALMHNQELTSANIQAIKSDVNYMKGDIEKTKRNMSAVEKVTVKNWSELLEIKDAK